MSAVAAVQKSPTAAFSNFMDKLKPQMALALPKHLNADRMARLAMTAFSSSPQLRECDLNSIAASIMVAAQLGLEPGVNGAGYLIPYKDKCTFVPGWKGLVDLVSRSGRATVWTGAVLPTDKFEYQFGDVPFCKHVPGDDDEGNFTHVYAIGRVRDAFMPIIEVWSRNKVLRHLKQYNKVGGQHYATKDENNLQMYGRKCALLQVLKYMPSSVELTNAIDVSNAAEAGRVVAIDGNMVVNLDGYSDSEQGEGGQAEQAPVQAAARQALPDCPEQKLAAFIDDVARGRRSDEDVINMLLSRHALTSEQMARIKAAKVAA